MSSWPLHVINTFFTSAFTLRKNENFHRIATKGSTRLVDILCIDIKQEMDLLSIKQLDGKWVKNSQKKYNYTPQSLKISENDSRYQNQFIDEVISKRNEPNYS